MYYVSYYYGCNPDTFEPMGIVTLCKMARDVPPFGKSIWRVPNPPGDWNC
jgi:hypothetical protein